MFFFSSRRRHTRSVSAFLLNRSSDLRRFMIIPMLCVTIFVILVVWFLLPRVARLMIHTPTAISIFVCLSMVQLMAVFISMRCTLCGHFLQVALRSEERFSRNAETDLVCRLLLEKNTRRRASRPGSRARPPRERRSSTPGLTDHL